MRRVVRRRRAGAARRAAGRCGYRWQNWRGGRVAGRRGRRRRGRTRRRWTAAESGPVSSEKETGGRGTGCARGWVGGCCGGPAGGGAAACGEESRRADGGKVLTKGVVLGYNEGRAVGSRHRKSIAAGVPTPSSGSVQQRSI